MPDAYLQAFRMISAAQCSFEEVLGKREATNEEMKTYSLDQVQDKLLGKIGTPDRDFFEYELQMDLIGKAIKQTRQERHLTQE